MKKRLFKYLLVSLTLLCNSIFVFNSTASALELKNTTSNCTLSESQCSNTTNCIYISSKQCGIVATENISYTCYYKYYNNPSTIFLKATFNASGIASIEVEHDIPNSSKILGKITEKREPITYTNRNIGITYYTCPSSLTEYKIENVTINGITTTQRYYTPVIYELTDHSITFSLLEDSNYNGVMAILPENEKVPPDGDTKDQLECRYHYNQNNVQISLIVTYVDDNTITVSELISANGGNSSGQEFDTKYIKQSEEFKNWKCSSQSEVYVVSDGDKKYISYNEDDLKEISDYVNRLEGETPPESEDPNLGDPVYGCEVIPYEIRAWIKSTLDLVKYVALVLVIVLGILDFIKAAASGEADQMKKSGSSFLKRIIAVVILFLLPLIVELILNLIEIYGADSTCLPE